VSAPVGVFGCQARCRTVRIGPSDPAARQGRLLRCFHRLMRSYSDLDPEAGIELRSFQQGHHEPLSGRALDQLCEAGWGRLSVSALADDRPHLHTATRTPKVTRNELGFSRDPGDFSCDRGHGVFSPSSLISSSPTHGHVEPVSDTVRPNFRRNFRNFSCDPAATSASPWANEEHEVGTRFSDKQRGTFSEPRRRGRPANYITKKSRHDRKDGR
jgi:hypothetical protein